MQIGSLLDNRLAKNISYSYCELGSDTPLLPDLDTEASQRDVYTAQDGNLFYNTDVSWKHSTLLIGGIDIKVKADTTCFIDYVNIIQQKNTYIERVEIFTIEDDDNYRKIGEYVPKSQLDLSPKYVPTKMNIESELEYAIPVGYYCDNVVVRLISNCNPIGLQKLDIWAAWDLDDGIFPVPDKALFDKKSFALKDLKTVSAKSEEELFAASYLNEKLSLKFGHSLEIVSDNGDVEITKNDTLKEDFEVISKNGKVLISGSNRGGILHAADAFLQTIDDDIVKNAEISHSDFKEIRGIHIQLPERKDADFFKNLVKHVLVPMHYNTIFIQLTATMRFKKHPELNEGWLKACEMVANGTLTSFAHYDYLGHDVWEQEEIAELCKFLEDHGIEVIPEIQSFGHSQYVTWVYPEWQKYLKQMKDLFWMSVPPKSLLMQEFLEYVVPSIQTIIHYSLI